MSGNEIQAQVVRYDVTKLSVVRNAVPVVILVTTAAKYIGSYALVGAIALQVAVIVLFIRARASLGKHTIKAKSDALIIPGVEPAIRRYTTIGWTLAASTARVYGPKCSYRFVVPSEESDALKALLTQALGDNLEMRPRGSSRARALALTAAIAGVAAIGVGLALEALPIALLGLAAVLIASTAYGVLSQRIAQPVRAP